MILTLCVEKKEEEEEEEEEEREKNTLALKILQMQQFEYLWKD